MKTAIGIISVLIMMPIRFYLMWYLLNAVSATELPMFIFWVSIPVGILVHLLSESVKKSLK